jgi:predicted CXXCH cytochrome family protein
MQFSYLASQPNGGIAADMLTPSDGVDLGSWTSLADASWVETATYALGTYPWLLHAAVDPIHDTVFVMQGNQSSWFDRLYRGVASTLQFKDAVLLGSPQAGRGDKGYLDSGSAIEYASASDRLFVVNRASGADGHLWWVQSPSHAAKGSHVDPLDTGVAVSTPDASAPYAHSDLQSFSRGGTEYMACIAPGASGAYQLRIASNLGGSPPSVTTVAQSPWGGTLYMQAVALRWDGGDYLYLAGRSNAGTYLGDIYRIRIPSDPVNGPWAAWELATKVPPVSGSNWRMEFLTATMPAQRRYGYHYTGTASTEVQAPATATSWASLTWTATVPDQTGATVAVEGLRNGSWVSVAGMGGLAPGTTDLSGLSTAVYPRLRLTVTLASPTRLVTPRFTGWSVSATTSRVVHRDPAVTGPGVGAITCASCHNVHNVGAGTGVGDPARVSDPANTRKRATDTAATMTEFCLGCHKTGSIRASSTATRTVAYDVLFGWKLGAPYFTGFDKETPGLSPLDSAHSTSISTKATCITCHDPHGSDNPNLLAWTLPASFTGGVAGIRDNVSGAALEENLCLQCHGNGTVGRRAPGADDVATPLAGANRHTVLDVAGAHTDQESAAALGDGTRHSECVDCHDPHAARAGTHAKGAAVAAPALYGAVGAKPVWGANWTGATGFESIRLKGGAGDAEAYLCFKCHTSATTLPAIGPSGMAYTDLALEFNPNNQSYHNVLGLKIGAQESFSVGGSTYYWQFRGNLKAPWTKNSGLTCTDCHTNETVGAAKGPHGTSTPWMIDPVYSGDFKNAFFNRVNTFPAQYMEGTTPSNLVCWKCHDLSNGNRTHIAFNAGNYPVHVGGPGDGEKGYCTNCHIQIPHGWKRPRLLGYRADPAPYATRADHGVEAIALKNYGTGPNEWNYGDCYATGCNYGGKWASVHAIVPAQVWP